MNDRSSSRWDDRSDSAWSQSPERSSDHSSERSSPHRPPKKAKKKAKRKKVKKRKHSKKRKSKLQESPLSEGERSPSSERRSKISSHHDKRSHSASRSPTSHRHLATGRRRRSPLTPSNLRSYSRSYTSSRSRSRGRSRSYSRSRSLSRSRSRSLSRSRSQSYSRSRSRSRTRYRYRSRSLSRSKKRNLSGSSRKRKVGKPKPEVSAHASGKGAESNVTLAPRLPIVPAPESVPVIPLSDSPPPSRWKPGQKPWKPSYIHISDIKVKQDPNLISSTKQAASNDAEKLKTSVAQKCVPEDSQSRYSHPQNTQRHARRSYSGSSRSRSYSRSYSRSRSRSGSRSRSRSSRQNNSRSSSCSQSDSGGSCKGGSIKNKSLDKEWKQYYSSLRRIINLDNYLSLPTGQDPAAESEDKTDSEHSPNLSGSKGSSSLRQLKEKGHSQEQEKQLHNSNLPLEEPNSKSDWDSDGDKVSERNSANSMSKKHKPAFETNDILEKRLAALAGWDSESDSEKVPSKITAISEKEEGEASSESEQETNRKTSTLEAPGNCAPPHLSKESFEKVAEPERHRSKKKAKRKHKHKRRGETKSGSHRTKDKAKRSKRKHQKLKETFHWQPPLEFGEEEEEEDESQKEKRIEQKRGAETGSLAKLVKERPSRSPSVDSLDKQDHILTSSNKNGSVLTRPHRREEHRQMTREQKTKPTIPGKPKHTEPQDQCSNKNGVNSANLPNVQDQTESLDDMDICTPEHDTEASTEPPVTEDPFNKPPEVPMKNTSAPLNKTSKDGDLFPQPHVKEQQSASSAVSVTIAGGQQNEMPPGKATGSVIDLKWKPLKGMSALQTVSQPPVIVKSIRLPENQTTNTQVVRMEIKSKSRVRPGSLFDEVRKTARLNQRPRNQESSSEEKSPSVAAGARGKSRSRSTRKSRSGSSHRSHSRGRSHSYSRSRSRSRSSSYSSRSEK